MLLVVSHAGVVCFALKPFQFVLHSLYFGEEAWSTVNTVTWLLWIADEVGFLSRVRDVFASSLRDIMYAHVDSTNRDREDECGSREAGITKLG